MKINRRITALSLWLLICISSAFAQQDPDSIFEQYFRNAQTFADTYPREKAYLHFDNTSYFIGDTIWFKAYVTLAEGNIPSNISKPLYVELLDQLGNIMDKQIVKLKDGEGYGQIVMKAFCLPGYYEVRAYTRWMQAFDEKQYFSRTFPIYRKIQTDGEIIKSIGTYHLDKSMKQRPQEKQKDFNLRFFPEGGSLVEGVTSLIAFEAEGKKKGPATFEGVLKDRDGTILTRFRSLHEGMGYFLHTPGEKPAIAEVEYEGKKMRFTLPKALPQGYVLHVANQRDTFDIQISRSSTTLNDTLALFVSQQGRPFTYKKIEFGDAQILSLTLPKQICSGGVVQLSLVNARGETLCERLCYVMPDVKEGIEIVTSLSNEKICKPHMPICCKLSVRDKEGKPIKSRLSISIRDALNSDYQEYDQTIYTDLLLTSDLKGYIHQPGYYFANRSPQRQRELDALMLVRGWRKYDMAQIIGAKKFKPIHMPEETLVIKGQIWTYGRKKAKEDMGVTIMLKKDSLAMLGATVTDSLGYFSIPVDELDGNMEALIQTRKKDKKRNKLTTIRLLRNFSPAQRKYGYHELHPVYVAKDSLRTLSTMADSLYEDSLLKLNHSHALNEVMVKAKRKKNSVAQFEQNILAYYNVPTMLDELRDEGKIVDDLSTLLKLLNPNIRVSRVLGEIPTDIISYNTGNFSYLVNGALTSFNDISLYIENDVDALRYIILGYSKIAPAVIDIDDPEHYIKNLQVMYDSFYQSPSNNIGSTSNDGNGKMSTWREVDPSDMICQLITVDNWRKEKKYSGAWGIRRTQIQSYSKPLEFYSPTYEDLQEPPTDDHRRTLYWNPNLETDEKGEAIINCYNSNNSTFITISAETLWRGKPAALIK